MAANGGEAQRISFGDGAYSTPVWSPRGDYIAFTKQTQGRFAIGIMRAGRFGRADSHRGLSQRRADLVAERTRDHVLPRPRREAAGPMLYTVDVTGRNEQPLKTPSYASDPAWSPLLQ